MFSFLLNVVSFFILSFIGIVILSGLISLVKSNKLPKEREEQAK